MVVLEPRPMARRWSIWRALLSIMLISLVLLIVANAALYLSTSNDRPGRPNADRLLYATTFDEFANFWEQFPGQDSAEVKDGALHIRVNSPNGGAYSHLKTLFSDFDLRVNTTWTEMNSDYGEIAVLYSLQDPDNFYAFRIRGDGAYRVEIHEKGQIEAFSEWQISPYITTGVNATNLLRVITRAGHFEFYANGQLLNLCLKGDDKKSTWTGPRTGNCLSNERRTSREIVDTTFEFGQIALAAFTDTPGLHVTFDNVLISGPSDLRATP
jgi:hypothetical protein